MKHYTQIVKENNSLKLMKFTDYIPAFIANIFSIIFSTSIILELRGVVHGMVLTLLAAFIILFLIQNEFMKVKEVRKMFTGCRNAILPFIITFIISISLASIGIYLYTNKATEIRDKSEINKTTEILAIDSKYQNQFEEIHAMNFEGTKEFENISTELKYWKRASAASLVERTEIRNKVDNLQNQLNTSRLKFEASKTEQLTCLDNLVNNEKNIIEAEFSNTLNNTHKNNFISYIFLTLIIITEFSTIVLNKNIVEKRKRVNEFTKSKIAKTYLIASNLLTTLFMSVRDGWVNINNAKYSFANKDNMLEWEEIKTIYNNFISLGILSSGEVRKENNKELIYNELLLNEPQAQMKLDEYFERFLKIA